MNASCRTRVAVAAFLVALGALSYAAEPDPAVTKALTDLRVAKVDRPLGPVQKETVAVLMHLSKRTHYRVIESDLLAVVEGVEIEVRRIHDDNHVTVSDENGVLYQVYPITEDEKRAYEKRHKIKRRKSDS